MKTERRRFSVSLSALSIIAITAAPAAAVSVCIAIFATVYSEALLRETKLGAEQTVQQTALSVNNYLDSMRDKLSFISSAVSESTSADELEDEISVITRMQKDIYAVSVYDGEGNIISCTGGDKELKATVYQNLSFDKELFGNAEDFALSSPHVQTMFNGEYPWVVTLASKTDSPVFGQGIYVAIDFEFSEIAKYIDNVGIGGHGYCFITDSGGNIIYHPQQQMIFSGLKTENTELVKSLEDGVHYKDNIIYTLKTTSDKLWRVAGVTFTDELAVERRTQIVVSIAFSFFCCAVIAIVVLLIYSKIVNEPVRSLMRAMKAFERHADNFSYTGGTETVSELRVLSHSFEHMAKTIQNLMEQVHREEKELRKTELKALQAQINPHFLYNTLDSIQWMCEQGKTKDAAEMVRALARLFRISISKGRELITIKEELQHAENYLIIQSYRYRNQFSYRIEADPKLDGCLCNKITVQPLIENAIYHGLDRMVDEGKILVTVKQAGDDENDILITVGDNGVGMTKEQCEKILKKERSDSGGIGVKNVNDRLKIYFGEKYGLTIESELDVGTKVTARIPKLYKEAENEL